MQPTLLDMIIKAESEDEAMENITYIVAGTYRNERGNYINNYMNFKDLHIALLRIKYAINNDYRDICLWAKYPGKIRLHFVSIQTSCSLVL